MGSSKSTISLPAWQLVNCDDSQFWAGLGFTREHRSAGFGFKFDQIDYQHSTTYQVFSHQNGVLQFKKWEN